MSGERRLIVNADDFGRSPGINRAIVDCHHQGIVTSTTLMVNLPWTGEAIDLWRGCQSIGLGLHLNFCYGSPISDADAIPSLVDPDGRLIADTGWLRQHAAPAEIAIEARAQMDRFTEITARRPTHVDSHKYLHSTPGIRDAVIEVASAYGIAVRAVSDADRSAIRRAGLPTSDHFESRFHGLDGIGVSTEILERALRELLPGVTELMCHPGYVDEHILDSSYSSDREREVESLTAVEIRQVIEDLDIRLIGFAEL